MKITIISDTHKEHHKFTKLSGEVLIHCGDMLNLANRSNDDLEEIDEWFGRQDFKLILCVGGNHDIALQEYLKKVSSPFKNAVYLQDEYFDYRGMRFYGAPWVPELSRHAFYQNTEQLEKSWSMIPADVDVLITHTPPAKIMDTSSRGFQLGCTRLAAELVRISPKLHCFGHVHASAGTLTVGQTLYVNASSANSQFRLTRPPFVVDL